MIRPIGPAPEPPETLNLLLTDKESGSFMLEAPQFWNETQIDEHWKDLSRMQAV
jgi:hypothetical protein